MDPDRPKPNLTMHVDQDLAAWPKEDDPVGKHIDKRLYVPGVKLKSECPECGEPWRLDLTKEYVVQYPENGRPYEVWAECSQDHEWMAGKMRYVLTVQIVDETQPA